MRPFPCMAVKFQFFRKSVTVDIAIIHQGAEWVSRDPAHVSASAVNSEIIQRFVVAVKLYEL